MRYRVRETGGGVGQQGPPPSRAAGRRKRVSFAPGVPLFGRYEYRTRKVKVGAGRARRRPDGPSSIDERPDQAVASACVRVYVAAPYV